MAIPGILCFLPPLPPPPSRKLGDDNFYPTPPSFLMPPRAERALPLSFVLLRGRKEGAKLENNNSRPAAISFPIPHPPDIHILLSSLPLVAPSEIIILPFRCMSFAVCRI